MGESLIRINPPVTATSIGAVAKGDLVLNVKDYGAKGDGTTDDTAAFHAARDAAGAARCVVVPAGTYSISALSLNVAAQSWKFLAGAIVTQRATGGTASWLVTLGAAGVTLSGGTWDGNKSAQTSQNGLIRVTADNCTVEYATARNGTFYGVLSTGAAGSVIRGNKITNTDYIGIYVVTSGASLSGATVTGNTVDRSAISASTIVEGGLKVHGNSNGERFSRAIVSSNTVIMPTSPTDSTAICLEIQHVNRSTIVDNFTEGGTIGVSLSDSVESTAENNEIFGASQYGLELSSGSGSSALGNTIFGNGVTALGIDMNSAATGCVVSGNTITGTTSNGIQIEGPSTNWTVLGNTVTMSAVAYAVNVRSGQQSGSIVGNVLSGGSTATKAIVLEASWQVSITGNTVSNFTQNVVLFYATTAVTFTGVSIIGNTIASTPNSPFATQLSGGATISGCKAVGNTGTVDYSNVGSDVRTTTGSGAPEGAIAASPGSIFQRSDGSPAAGTLYVKESGTSNTGWRARDARFNVTTQTSAYTAAAFDAVRADASSGAFAVTLPTATAGVRVIVKKTDSSANAVTLTGTVDGVSNPTIVNPYDSVELIGNGSSWDKVTAITTTTISPIALQVMGEDSSSVMTLPRRHATSLTAFSSGNVVFTYFTALKSLTITKVGLGSATAPSGTATLVRFGLYTVDASDNLTLVAATASDTTVFASANTFYERSLSSGGSLPTSYSLIAGNRYAVGVIATGYTSWAVTGISGNNATVFSLSPKLGGIVTAAQTDLPTSLTATGLSADSRQPFARLAV